MTRWLKKNQHCVFITVCVYNRQKQEGVKRQAEHNIACEITSLGSSTVLLNLAVQPAQQYTSDIIYVCKSLMDLKVIRMRDY